MPIGYVQHRICHREKIRAVPRQDMCLYNAAILFLRRCHLFDERRTDGTEYLRGASRASQDARCYRSHERGKRADLLLVSLLCCSYTEKGGHSNNGWIEPSSTRSTCP